MLKLVLFVDSQTSAKNIILAGVKSVTLYDPAPVQVADLSSQVQLLFFVHSLQFFLHSQDIGLPRDQTSAPRLSELNNYVPVSVLTGDLDAQIPNYQVIILTNASIDKQLSINAITRKHGLKFISADIRGLFGYAFNDFGDEFYVSDTTGEEPISGIVSSVTQVSHFMIIFPL